MLGFKNPFDHSLCTSHRQNFNMSKNFTKYLLFIAMSLFISENTLAESPEAEKWISIKSSANGEYLHASGTDNRATIYLESLREDWWSQQWIEEQIADNVFRYRNAWTNNYLTNMERFTNSQVQSIELNNSARNQQWIKVDKGQGSYTLQSANNNAYLSAENGTSKAKLLFSKDYTGSAQKWEIIHREAYHGRNAPIIDTDFEQKAAALQKKSPSSSAGYGFYYEDGEKFDMPTQGETASVWISASNSYTGEKSLGVRVKPSKGVKDRIEFRPVHGQNDKNYALRYGQTRWFSYAFKIHPSTDVPTGWLHFTQVWQRPIAGIGEKPPISKVVPLTLSLRKNVDRFQMYASLKTSLAPSTVATRPFETEATQTSKNFIDVTPGTWNTLVFKLTPSHVQDEITGNLQMYLNDELIVDHDGDWGVVPGEQTQLEGSFDVRVGIYRKAQQTDTVLFFDDVKYGTSREAVSH